MEFKSAWLFVIILSLFLAFGCQQETKKSRHKIPGSFHSLSLMSKIRAYPQEDIPKAAYGEAFDYYENTFLNQRINTRNSDTWEAMGPLNTAGRTLTVAINPQADETIYAGSASGGLWRSRQLGLNQSWSRVNIPFPVLGVSTIEFAPGDSTEMYIGTGEVYNINQTGNDGTYRSTRGSYGIGILKSNDGGKTWRKSLDWTYNQQHGVWMIKVSPSNPNIVYAATTDGVYKSEDAGDSWTQMNDIPMGTDIEVNPDNPDIIVAAFGNLNSSRKGIYKSQDGGVTWANVLPPEAENFQGKIQLDYAPSDPNIMYASIGNGFWFDDGFTWLYKSEDFGSTWTLKNQTDYSRWQGWFAHDVSVSPDNPNEFIAVGIDIYSSDNAGDSLYQKSFGGVTLGTAPLIGPDGNPTYSHSDHHFVHYHPNIKDLVLFGNDGGVFLSYDRGQTFRSANGGMQTTQFYNGFSVSQNDGEFALGGLQDNSTVIYTGSPAWRRVIGGDGSWSAINQDDDNIIYGSWQNLNINRSDNQGNNFYRVSDFPSDNNPLFISPYVSCPSNPNILYTSGRYINKSIDGGFSWFQTNDSIPLNGDPVFALEVSPQDENVVYCSTVPENEDATLFTTVDGGIVWKSFSLENIDRIANDITVDPQDPSIAYIAFSGFGGKHIFKLMDYGNEIIDITGNLPDVPANAIIVDINDSNRIYIGNDIGVFYTENDGEDWEVLELGLPPAAIVMDLKISSSDNMLWAATHGNGSYRRSLIESSVATNDAKAENIKIYPNPTDDVLNISGEWQSFKIYSLNGQLILSSQYQQSISLPEMSPGMYVIDIINEQNSTRKTFVKL